MLGKLIKYEWKGLRTPFLIMLIVLAATMVLTCGVILTINPEYDETLTGFSLMGLVFSVLLYYFGIIGCTLGTSLIIVIRFYKTCYTDQGYLTHTLPVTANQILNAKIIAAIITELLMGLAIIVSLLIIVQVGLHHIFSFIPDYTYREMMDELSRELSSAFRGFEDELGIRFGLFILYMIVYSVIAVIANVVTIFGCVSLGQLYAKHRIIGAIAAYFIVQFVMQIISYFTSIPIFTRTMVNGYNTTFFGVMSPSMNLTLFIVVVVAVIMYFVNLQMMTKRLNLE